MVPPPDSTESETFFKPITIYAKPSPIAFKILSFFSFLPVTTTDAFLKVSCALNFTFLELIIISSPIISLPSSSLTSILTFSVFKL